MLKVSVISVEQSWSKLPPKYHISPDFPIVVNTVWPTSTHRILPLHRLPGCFEIHGFPQIRKSIFREQARVYPERSIYQEIKTYPVIRNIQRAGIYEDNSINKQRVHPEMRLSREQSYQETRLYPDMRPIKRSGLSRDHAYPEIRPVQSQGVSGDQAYPC